ncbi:MAG TPA: MaoC family dehydratase [Acidimicrobiia bacterium]|nr:MaoC family dehydratase [Acidimicrobiia bacterium]
MPIDMPRFESLVGTEVGVGEWMEITQDRVDAFADVTDDHPWIHQAGEAADNGPFGGPIAHGFLTLSLFTALTGTVVAGLGEGAAMAINYGFERIRFVSPVRVGSRIRARVKLLEATQIDNGVQLKNEITLEIDGMDRPGVVAEHLVRYYG